jgi:hypothetical protein
MNKLNIKFDVAEVIPIGLLFMFFPEELILLKVVRNWE